ncbi:ATP phosphoribosyltransferase [Aureococcus anophagefferens]|uniref:ATP phosphoribosyltransferase n=1 Tax=Aureococcus anophagefferens TaxID=44056 RepID=A0ABR1G2L4_AURAN
MHRLLAPARSAFACSAVALTQCSSTQRDEGAQCHGAGSGHGGGAPLPQKWLHAHVPKERPHLLFGIPKKGRLHEKIKDMLKGAGIEYTREPRLDIAHCNDLPVSLVFLPAADIATYVGEGDVDLGITGEDIIAESEVDVKELMKLGFGKCRLCVQAPKGSRSGPGELAGQRIVTSFPNLTKAYFAKLEAEGHPTRIKCISGSVEAACGLGLADGIVDLVETGTTMRAAGLEEVSTIMPTQTVLIANKHSRHAALIETLRKRLAGYLTASRYMMIVYNVDRDNLAQATAITPGKNSPSIMPLERSNWVAVSALVPKKKAAQLMDDLEAVGATDILLTSLASSRMGD